jgi:predicted AlkP superfamily phosphohydrolase/phosphomutase
MENSPSQTSRCIAIWLDGFSIDLARRFVAEGLMPHLARVLESGAVIELDHGGDQATGLAGEHLSSGLDSDASGRFAAVHFDAETYSVMQRGSIIPTAFDGLDQSVVAFDIGYLPVGATDHVEGLLDWGCHDPGGPRSCRPDGLLAEVEKRFGSYPAAKDIYGITWPDVDACRSSGERLAAAVGVRSGIAEWLLAEKFPGWQLALVGVSEAHSANESLWHGVDEQHLLAAHPSASVSLDAMRRVHASIDDMIGDLRGAFPDCTFVVFSMSGMGHNASDITSMVALGELLAAWHTGETIQSAAPPAGLVDGVPMLGPAENWNDAALTVAGVVRPKPRPWHTPARKRADRNIGRGKGNLGWMPLTRHAPTWPGMRAFALPSFYDGRIRVNLRGRESRGVVAPTGYSALLDELEELLADCSDPRTGAPVVKRFTRPLTDPFDAGETSCDLLIQFAGSPLGLVHPVLGTSGPFPPRRPGGHTDPIGFAAIVGDERGIETRSASSFDLVPTLLDLAGARIPSGLSGRTLLRPSGER